MAQGSGKQGGASRWYPTRQQLRDPVYLERSFRQTLVQQYAMQDRLAKLEEQMANQGQNRNQNPGTGSGSSFPPGSGPADSMLLGLPVSPADTSTLVDGTKLTFVKAQGVFKFL